MGRPREYREVEVLECVRTLMTEMGESPTVRELAQRLEIQSAGTVHRYLTRLRVQGFIEWEPGKHRSIRLRSEETTHSS